MVERNDVLVAGAGVFGVTGALELQKRGLRVRLIDPGPLPHPEASSTDISKVVRMDYGADEFYVRQMELALEGWRKWNESWASPLFHETGFLMLTGAEMEPGTYEGDSYALLGKRGHAVERLDAERIAERFPAWKPGAYIDGYFNPQGGWAESGRVVETLLAECRQAGVDVQPGVRAQGLLSDRDGMQAVMTDRGEMRSRTVVLAVGAWAPGILPGLERHIWPVAQPVFHFQATQTGRYQPPEFPVWTTDVARTGWYGFPALDDGTLKIANHGPGSRAAPSAGIDVTQDREGQFRAFLQTSLPDLAHAHVLHTRTCYYADSWDGDFYITSVPSIKGLYVAGGGSGHAFKFAPLMGGWIADAVEARQSEALDRFGWREPRERQSEAARNL